MKLSALLVLYNVRRKKFMSCFNRAVQTFVDSIWSTRKLKTQEEKHKRVDQSQLLLPASE